MLVTEGIECGYGRLKVLHGVSIRFSRGETIAVMGANGAGKSTLCRTISGQVLLRAGRIMVDGDDISTWSTARRVEAGIIQVPEGRQIFPDMSVLENLRLGAFTRSGALDEDLDRVHDLFPILKARYDQRAGLMSGGEQQMLAVARALMARPNYLLLDEPSQGLAPKIVDELGEAIRKVASTGVGVLLVEQNLALAEMVAEHAFILESGRCSENGPLRALLAGSALQRSYLGAERHS